MKRSLPLNICFAIKTPPALFTRPIKMWIALKILRDVNELYRKFELQRKKIEFAMDSPRVTHYNGADIIFFFELIIIKRESNRIQ